MSASLRNSHLLGLCIIATVWANSAWAQCYLGVEGGSPAHPNSCDNQSTTFGSGAYRDITIQSNTYYVFSWNNNGAPNINGFCAAPQNGTGSSGPFTTNQTAWFSGTTTILRVSANRSSPTWSPTGSAILTYRRTEPSLASNSPTAQTICPGQSVNIAGGSPTSGVRYWQGSTVNGVATTNSGTPNSTGALNTPGAYNFYYRPLNGVNGGTGGCWGTQQVTTVTVNPVPVASATPSSQDVCSGTSTSITLSSSLGGTSYSWTAVASAGVSGHSNGSGSSISQVLSKASGASGTVTYTITPTSGGCPGASIQVVVTVNPVPVATATPASQSICSGASTSIILSSGVPGTTYSWTVSGTAGTGGFANGSGSTISQTLTKTAGSSGTVTYVVTPTANGCVGSPISVPITVDPLPTPTFNSLGGPYCISQTTPISLVGFGVPTPPPGSGVFSGTGVAGNDFVPSLAAVGTNTLTYTYTDANGCVNSAQRTVQVIGLPLVNFSGLSSAGYCINNSTPVPLTGFPAGGFFSGPGVSGSSFTPSVAGIGLHAIVYTYTDANGCVNSETRQVNVFALPAVGIFDLAPQYCVTDAPVTISGFPPGGNFSGTGISGNQFSPAVAGVGGPYIVTYTYTDANSCSNSTTAQVTVNAVTSANAGTGGNSCGLGFQLGAQPTAGTGTWSQTTGPGSVSFSPSANAPNATATVTAYGTYTFTWTEVNGACSSAAQVTVNYYQQPVANAGSGGTECDFDFSLGATPSVGTGLWTQTVGPGTASFGNSTSGSTVVNVSQAGNYTFTWTETNGTCVSSAPVNVVFTDQPVANAGPDADACDLDHVLSAVPSFGTGTWSQLSGPGASSFSAVSSATATVTVSSYGQYVYQWSETNGTCTDAATVTVNFYEEPNANAGFGGFECDLDFGLSAIPSVGVGTWSLQSGPGTASFAPNSNAANAIVSVGQYGAYTFRWQEENGVCSDNASVTVIFDQQTNANAGIGGNECDLTFTFNGTASVGTGIWTSTGPGTAYYTNDNSATSSVTVSDYGSYVFTWTETNGTCVTSDQVTINFYEQPVANAGQGGDACDLDFVLGAVASVGLGTWTQTSGNGTASFDNANLPNATVTVSAYGTYTFQWEEVNGTCSDNASVTVNFYQQPVADAGSGGDECDLDFDLAANAGIGTGIWTVGSGPGTALFADAANPATSVAVSAYGTYSFTWTETNGSCSDGASVTVNFYEQPIANAGPGGDACDLDFALNATLSTGAGIWTQTSGSGTASFGNVSSPSTTVIVDQYDTYVFTWTETNGTCSDVSGVTVNFWNQPNANAGQGGDACDLDFGLNAIPSLGSGEWTQTGGSGTSSFVSSTSANTVVSVDQYGTYTYTWTETNGTCISSDVITVNYYEQPVANAGVGGSECDLDFVLNATPTVGAGAWSQTLGAGFSNFVANAIDPNATVQVSQYGQYAFTWTETNGSCVDAQSVSVDFFEQPVALIGALSDQCDLDITLSAAPTAGTVTWSATGPGSVVFTPDANDPNAVMTVSAFGQYIIICNAVNGSCSDVATATVNFYPLPVVSFTGLASTYCVDQSSPVQLAGTPTGGMFSGTGISGSLFVPSIAGVGPHNVTYTYTDVNGCIDSETQSTEVMPIPVVSFSGLGAAYCVSDAAQNALSGSPAGGVFSGAGISGNAFVASNAGVGTHVITYSYSDGFNCTGSTTQTVIVNPLPVVSISGLAAAYCADAAQTVLVGSPAGGVFSGSGMSGSAFNPAMAGVGIHAVTYTFTDGNGCSNSVTQSVTVNALPQPVVTPAGQQEICAGSSLMLDAGNGFGQYAWSNGQNGQSLTVSAAGAYTATVIDQNGCTATSAPVNVIVNALPVVDLGNDTILCLGNTYTLDAGNPGLAYLWVTQEQTQQITVGLTGNYTVQVTDANGCIGTDAVLVSFSNLLQPVITAGGPTTFCQGGSVLLVGPAGLTYEWSTGEVSQNILVSQSGPVELTVQDQFGCTGVSNTINVNVNQLPNAVVVASGPTNLCQGGTVTLTASNTFSSYLWNPTGATGQSIVVGQPGSYSVVVTDPVNGCSATSIPVVVTQAQGVQPTIVANGPLEFCVGGSVVLSVEPAGAFSSYLWSSGSTTETITVTSGAQIGVSVLDANNCLNESLLASPTTVTVWNPQPIVEQNGGTLAVINGPFTCYQWFRNGNPVPGATFSIFTPELSGNHYVQVCDENGCFGNSSNVEFTVGIADVRDLYDLNIYPNPNGGQFTVETDLGSHVDVMLTLRDVLGRELMIPERIEGASSFRRTFDLGHLSNGVYYVQLLGNDGMTVRQVVKR
jgi:trimeric autotransporter adhesin